MVNNTYFGTKRELKSKIICYGKLFYFKSIPQELLLGHHVATPLFRTNVYLKSSGRSTFYTLLSESFEVVEFIHEIFEK